MEKKRRISFLKEYKIAGPFFVNEVEVETPGKVKRSDPNKGYIMLRFRLLEGTLDTEIGEYVVRPVLVFYMTVTDAERFASVISKALRALGEEA